MQIKINSLETAEVVLTDADDDVSVRVAGFGRISVNVLRESGEELVFSAKIQDIIEPAEEIF